MNLEKIPEPPIGKQCRDKVDAMAGTIERHAVIKYILMEESDQTMVAD